MEETLDPSGSPSDLVICLRVISVLPCSILFYLLSSHLNTLLFGDSNRHYWELATGWGFCTFLPLQKAEAGDAAPRQRPSKSRKTTSVREGITGSGISVKDEPLSPEQPRGSSKHDSAAEVSTAAYPILYAMGRRRQSRQKKDDEESEGRGPNDARRATVRVGSVKRLAHHPHSPCHHHLLQLLSSAVMAPLRLVKKKMRAGIQFLPTATMMMTTRRRVKMGVTRSSRNTSRIRRKVMTGRARPKPGPCNTTKENGNS